MQDSISGKGLSNLQINSSKDANLILKFSSFGKRNVRKEETLLWVVFLCSVVSFLEVLMNLMTDEGESTTEGENDHQFTRRAVAPNNHQIASKISTSIQLLLSPLDDTIPLCLYSRSCNVGGFVYRLTQIDNYGFKIVSFDLSVEKFMELACPEGVKSVIRCKTELTIFRDSLALLHEWDYKRYHIWVMKESGVDNSWMKLFSVDLDGGVPGQRIVGFSMKGLMLVVGEGSLLVSPVTEDVKVVKYVTPEPESAWHVESYKESDNHEEFCRAPIDLFVYDSLSKHVKIVRIFWYEHTVGKIKDNVFNIVSFDLIIEVFTELARPEGDEYIFYSSTEQFSTNLLHYSTRERLGAIPWVMKEDELHKASLALYLEGDDLTLSESGYGFLTKRHHNMYEESKNIMLTISRCMIINICISTMADTKAINSTKSTPLEENHSILVVPVFASGVAFLAPSSSSSGFPLCLVVLQRIRESSVPVNMNLHLAELWVAVEGLPIRYSTLNIAAAVLTRVGDITMIDGDTGQFPIPRPRVRILVDLSIPLIAGCYFPTNGIQVVWVSRNQKVFRHVVVSPSLLLFLADDWVYRGAEALAVSKTRHLVHTPCLVSSPLRTERYYTDDIESVELDGFVRLLDNTIDVDGGTDMFKPSDNENPIIFPNGTQQLHLVGPPNCARSDNHSWTLFLDLDDKHHNVNICHGAVMYSAMSQKLLEGGYFSLSRDKVAVPVDSHLCLDVYLTDASTENVVFSGTLQIPVEECGSVVNECGWIEVLATYDISPPQIERKWMKPSEF
uniref:F-box associated beta-propeller type 1 domain-containing protein n=1 Tax=Chenopodium quinoa TaxID=63459 RepID=A0A803MGI7_CHEQI